MAASSSFARAEASCWRAAGSSGTTNCASRFLTGPISHNCSPPYNEGDALTMALDVGADLGNMSEAWAYPGAMVPGEEHDGHPVSRWIVGERALPHSIVVNRAGKRFVNEGVNYNDMSKALYHFDPQSYEFSNLPCWLIVDAQYRERYPIMTVMPTDPDPDWLTRARSLAEVRRYARHRRRRPAIDCRSLERARRVGQGLRLRSRRERVRALDRRLEGAAPEPRDCRARAVLRARDRRALGGHEGRAADEHSRRGAERSRSADSRTVRGRKRDGGDLGAGLLRRRRDDRAGDDVGLHLRHQRSEARAKARLDAER